MEVSPRLLPLRDIMQYILPTIIFFSLSLPLFISFRCWSLVEQLTFVAALSVLFGYIVTPPVQRFILLHVYPRFRWKLQWKLQYYRKWWQDVWTPELFYIIDARDQDYLFLINGYLYFYATVAAYLFLYSMLNVFRILGLRIPDQIIPGQIDLWCITPLLGGLSWHSFYLAIISFIASLISYCWARFEYDLMYNRTYPMIAVKYHNSRGRIIHKLFGKVMDEKGKGIKKATVVIINPYSSQEVDKVETNEQGYYKSSKNFLYLEADHYKVKVHKSCYKSEEREQIFSYNNMAPIEIELKRANA